MADIEGLSAEEIARIAESRKKRSFKKFTFRGVDLDKLLDLKPEELLPLFTSRIRRRLQRPIKRKHKALVKKLKNAKKNTGPLEKPAIIKTHLRDLIITPELIGSIVAIYNGKLFNPVEIKPEMVGMYTGEFSMSYRYVFWMGGGGGCFWGGLRRGGSGRGVFGHAHIIHSLSIQSHHLSFFLSLLHPSNKHKHTDP